MKGNVPATFAVIKRRRCLIPTTRNTDVFSEELGRNSLALHRSRIKSPSSTRSSDRSDGFLKHIRSSNILAEQNVRACYLQHSPSREMMIMTECVIKSGRLWLFPPRTAPLTSDVEIQEPFQKTCTCVRYQDV